MSERPTPSRPVEGRLTDGAFVLAVLAFILLTPPIIVIFNVPVFVFGVPLLHVYSFGVWLAAIVAGGVLSTRIARRGLRQSGRPTEPGDS
jgi:uncharacterized membrane protein YdjX (TVP38/TMEM64 family)